MSKRFAMGWRRVLALVAAVGLAGVAGCGGDGNDDGADDAADDASVDGTFQGAYEGTFSGTDEGTWQITVDGDGGLVGTAHSSLENLDYTIDGSVDEAGVLTAGLYTGDLYRGTYDGTISAEGAVGGTWGSVDGSETGTFAGQRQ